MTGGKRVGQRLQELGPYDTERAVGLLWKTEGWQTTITPASGDGGVDVIAARPSLDRNLYIQVKAYGPENHVGADLVEEYADLDERHPAADRIAIVTTSSFTSPAETLADRRDIQLVDGNDLRRRLKQSELRFADLGAATAEPNRFTHEWTWVPAHQIATHPDVNRALVIDELATVQKRLESRLPSDTSIQGPSFPHPAVSFAERTCHVCRSKTVCSFRTQLEGSSTITRWKACPWCLRLYKKSVGEWRLVRHLHPFQRKDITYQQPPVHSDAFQVCPVCRVRRPLWTAVDADQRSLIACTNCRTLWKRERLPTGAGEPTWRCIDSGSRRIRVGALAPEDAFRRT